MAVDDLTGVMVTIDETLAEIKTELEWNPPVNLALDFEPFCLLAVT